MVAIDKPAHQCNIGMRLPACLSALLLFVRVCLFVFVCFALLLKSNNQLFLLI